ncbi:hypothetical protein G9A89_003270, partial [Geosiphon pyriformis]
TGTDGIQKSAMEPLVCTSANLKQSCRNDAKNWIVLGFVPNLELTSSATRRNNPVDSAADYHHCLSVLLEPLKQLQKEMPVMSIRRGRFLRDYHIIAPVATIIGDNQALDKLCGKISNKTSSSVRMSRRCLTPYGESDTIPHVCRRFPSNICQKLSMAALGVMYKGCVGQAESLVSPNLCGWEAFMEEQASNKSIRPDDWTAIREARERLARSVLRECLGSHAMENAFDGVDFGHDSSVHTATMTDIMHTLEEGIFKYIIGILLDPMSDTEKSKLDGLGKNRSGEREQYPRVNFTRGFSSLSHLSADERVGQLFVISILLRTQDGKSLFSNRFDPDS